MCICKYIGAYKFNIIHRHKTDLSSRCKVAVRNVNTHKKNLLLKGRILFQFCECVSPSNFYSLHSLTFPIMSVIDIFETHQSRNQDCTSRKWAKLFMSAVVNDMQVWWWRRRAIGDTDGGGSYCGGGA